MASVDKNESTFTYQQVTSWLEQLFENRSLRIPVEGNPSRDPFAPPYLPSPESRQHCRRLRILLNG
jgi:hypothetical protein